jgi:predicted permease
MSHLLHDLRAALRALRRSPGFTAVAVLTLALGIGATTAIFAVLEKVVLDPLPYPEPERLVRLKNAVPGVGEGAEWQLSSAQYFYLRENARSLEAIGAYSMAGVSLEGAEGAVRGRAVLANTGTLELVGARATAGRLFDDRDDTPGAAPVAVLSHGFWKNHFGGDLGIVGRTVRMNELSFEVIGVMAPGVEPPGERGGSGRLKADLWVPLRLNPAGPFYNDHGIPAFARLAPGATAAEAQAEIERLTARLPEAYPSVYEPSFIDHYGFRTLAYPLKGYVLGDLSRTLWMLFGAVGLVLLIASANVANLFLARLEGRRRELVIRAALGAGRRAIASHYLAESLVLALSSALCAVLLGAWGLGGLVSLAPDTIPRLDEVRLSGTILLFALGVSLLVALTLTAIAVLRQGRVAGNAALGDGGRSATAGRDRQRVRSTLVATQVAFAFVLIVGAGLLLESFRRLRAVDPGVAPDGVLTLQLYLPYSRYESGQKRWQLSAALLERVRAMPGVEAAGFADRLPFTGEFGCVTQGFEDAAVYDRLKAGGTTTCAGQAVATPGHFQALGIPILAGRALTASDLDNPVGGAVVVSKAFAERFWPGEDPLGKGIAPHGRGKPPFYRVVGVVGDVYNNSVQDAPVLAVYYPMAPIPETGQFYPGALSLVVRTRLANPSSLSPAIRRAVQELDPAIPLANLEEMRTIVDRSMSRLSFSLVLIALAAGVALALAAIGLYGVISYLVTRRTGEIGVRIALGAQARQVERMVVRSAFGQIAAGLAAGLVAALVLTRLLRGLLYGVEPTHPLAYVAASALLAAVGVMASWVPARRAARVDPMVALRSE